MQDNSDTPASPPTLTDMSFEEGLNELRDIVTRLERGEGKLDDAMKAYERGAALKAHCERRLNEAKTRIDAISQNADGSFSAKPFEG